MQSAEETRAIENQNSNGRAPEYRPDEDIHSTVDQISEALEIAPKEGYKAVVWDVTNDLMNGYDYSKNYWRGTRRFIRQNGYTTRTDHEKSRLWIFWDDWRPPTVNPENPYENEYYQLVNQPVIVVDHKGNIER